MDKDFEKWLKKDELFEYYNTNPEQQTDIYKDFQREKEYLKPENIDEWVRWLCNNTELAEKHYPLLVSDLKERIQNTQPFKTANIIQKLPEHFTTWKTKINKHSGKYREKRIKEQITLLNSVLNEWQYSTEIEQQAVESILPYITEQLEYWKSELTALSSQQTGKKKPEQETPKTFEELFYNNELVKPCIDILKEVEPPLIDMEHNYIGKLKGIICVWIDELQRQGIVKHYSDRKIFALLISQKIKRFSIDESMFGKYHKKAEENYRTDIKTKVSKIKLSQSSQNGI